MFLRALFLASGLALSSFGAAMAQDQTATVPAPHPAEEAVLELYHALFFDTGIYDVIAEDMYPAYREAARGSDYYRMANEDQRAELDILIARTPEIIREEVMAESAFMAERVAPSAGALMRPEEIRELARLLRTPELRPIFRSMARDDAEAAEAEAALANSDIGRRLEAGAPVLDLLVAEMDGAVPRAGSRIWRRLSAEICRTLGDDCPQELREAAGEV